MATAPLIATLPMALAAMKSGVCSSARIVYAAPAAVGSAPISAPRNGPERSTATEVMTTTAAVIIIFRANPYQKIRSAGTVRDYLRLRLTSTGGPLLIVW